MNLRISPFSRNYFPAIGLNASTVAAATAITVLAIAILYKFVQNLLTSNTKSAPPPPPDTNPIVTLEVDAENQPENLLLQLPEEILREILPWVIHDQTTQVPLVCKKLNRIFYSIIHSFIRKSYVTVISEEEITDKNNPTARKKITFLITKLQDMICDYPHGNAFLGTIKGQELHPLRYVPQLINYLKNCRAIYTSLYREFIKPQNALDLVTQKDHATFNNNLDQQADAFRTWLDIQSHIPTTLLIPYGTPLDQENWNLSTIELIEFVFNKKSKEQFSELFIQSLSKISKVKTLILSFDEVRSRYPRITHGIEDYPQDFRYTSNNNTFSPLKLLDIIFKTATNITTLKINGMNLEDLSLPENSNLKNIIITRPHALSFINSAPQHHCAHLTIHAFAFKEARFLTKPIFPSLKSLELTVFSPSANFYKNENLKTLVLTLDNLSLPHILDAFPNLSTVELKNTGTPISINFQGLQHLKTLKIRGTGWTISGLDQLKELENLDTSSFSTEVQDQIINSKCRLTSLKFCADGLNTIKPDSFAGAQDVKYFINEKEIPFPIQRILDKLNPTPKLEKA